MAGRGKMGKGLGKNFVANDPSRKALAGNRIPLEDIEWSEDTLGSSRKKINSIIRTSHDFYLNLDEAKMYLPVKYDDAYMFLRDPHGNLDESLHIYVKKKYAKQLDNVVDTIGYILLRFTATRPLTAAEKKAIRKLYELYSGLDLLDDKNDVIWVPVDTHNNFFLYDITTDMSSDSSDAPAPARPAAPAVAVAKPINIMNFRPIRGRKIQINFNKPFELNVGYDEFEKEIYKTESVKKITGIVGSSSDNNYILDDIEINGKKTGHSGLSVLFRSVYVGEVVEFELFTGLENNDTYDETYTTEATQKDHKHMFIEYVDTAATAAPTKKSSPVAVAPPAAAAAACGKGIGRCGRGTRCVKGSCVGAAATAVAKKSPAAASAATTKKCGKGIGRCGRGTRCVKGSCKSK